MELKKVEGTKVRGGRYYLNLRIPAEAAAAFPGQTHLRHSLRTSDPKLARQGVIVAQAKLIEAAQGARQREMQAEAIAALPPDQRALFDEAGSVARLRAQFERTDMARAFMIAGGAVTPARPEVDYDEAPRKVIGLIDDALSIGEMMMAEAAHKAELTALDRVADGEAKVLHAMGEAVKSPTTFGLRELIIKLAALTGVRPETIDLQNRIASRFIDWHGDLPLTELTIRHLREFAEAYADTPANTSSHGLRTANFKDVIRVARAKNLPRISDVTRRQHVDTLKGLTSKAPSQGFLATDPWAQFGLILPTGKHAAAKVKPRLPFNPTQAKAVLADAAAFDPASIDRWGPMLAAYHGARLEEIGQLSGRNVFERDGVWCVQITDAGEGQKVKNGSSVRIIPLHRKVIEAGFLSFAVTRADCEYLFINDSGEVLKPMTPTPKGRVATNYSKRFGNRLRKKLKITDTRLTFHSFRHLWEDAAEDTDMPQTHRRDLAGRSRAKDSQAGYGEGPRLVALQRSLDRIDPLADRG